MLTKQKINLKSLVRLIFETMAIGLEEFATSTLFGIYDEYCMCDSLIATAIMVKAKLEKHVNSNHIPRIVFSY